MPEAITQTMGTLVRFDVCLKNVTIGEVADILARELKCQVFMSPKEHNIIILEKKETV